MQGHHRSPVLLLRHTAGASHGICSWGSRMRGEQRRRWLGWAAVTWLIAVIAGASLARAEPREADRLIVSWANGVFRLEGVGTVPRRLPGEESGGPAGARGALPTGAVSGFWYELRSCSGKVLHRQAMHDPRTAVVEWLETEADGSTRIARAEGRRAEALFTLLVPRHADSCEVVLVGRPDRTGGRRDGVREVGRLPWRGRP